jgi:hypothetical protein
MPNNFGGDQYDKDYAAGLRQPRRKTSRAKNFVLFAPHAPYPDHLKLVIERMRKLGPPSLHAYWRRNKKAWYAVEGSHRTAAAKHLGLIPTIIRVTLSSRVDHDTEDVKPDKRVSTLLKYYDDFKWWVRYEF